MFTSDSSAGLREKRHNAERGSKSVRLSVTSLFVHNQLCYVNSELKIRPILNVHISHEGHEVGEYMSHPNEPSRNRTRK